MPANLAYECNADKDLYSVLSSPPEINTAGLHSFSQGEVINDLMVRNKASIGIVDEDPGKSHHRERDKMNVILDGPEVELRKSGQKHLIIIKPDLESCFLAAMKRVGLTSNIAQDPGTLHRILMTSGSRRHGEFCEELRDLRKASNDKNVKTFITEIDAVLRDLAP